MTWLSRLFALAAVTALIAPAHASLMRYNFSGTIFTGPFSPVASWQGKHFSGYLDFDSATTPTTPGEWVLPNSTFELSLPGQVYEFTGDVTASVSPDRAAMAFVAIVPPDQAIYTTCCNSSLSLSFNTTMEDYFSLSTLPTTAPPGLAGVGYSDDFEFGFGSGSSLHVYVPEPASAALVLAGLIGLGRRRRSRSCAERLQP